MIITNYAASFREQPASKKLKFRKMKKIILSALVLSMGFAINAQEIPDRKSEKPGMMHKKNHHRGGMEMKSLNLTEDQKAKFKSQNEAFRKEMQELKKNENITVKDWKAKAETIRKQHKEGIQSILTSEQKAKMQEMKAKMQEKRKEGKVRSDDMRKNRGDRMKTELGLTADQSAKLETSHKAIREQMKAIRANTALSDEQKREQMKELHKKQKENLKSILTEEQLQKMKESRPSRDGMKMKSDKAKEI
jgi:Spy/CpxP family protein refolding chaperone